MDQVVFMDVLQPEGPLPNDLARLRHGQRPPLPHESVNAGPIDEFHDEVRKPGDCAAS